MKKKFFLATVASMSFGCGTASADDQHSLIAPLSQEVDAQTVETKSGRYRYEVSAEIDLHTLVNNTDLKMLDGNLGLYAIQLCGLDFNNKLRPDRCDVFTQTEENRLLKGYVTLTQSGDAASISTALETDVRKGGGGCYMLGDLRQGNYFLNGAPVNISGDFEAYIEFYRWEASPGNWKISNEIANEDATEGRWNIKRARNKLRINQERWNYCYSNPEIYIEEVFTHLVTLTKVNH